MDVGSLGSGRKEGCWDCGEMGKISRGLKLRFGGEMEGEKWGMVAALVVWVKARTKMGEKNQRRRWLLSVYTFHEFQKGRLRPHSWSKKRLKTKGFGRQMGLVQERKFLQIKSTFQCAQEWHISRFQGKTHFFYKNDDYAPIQHEIVKQRVSGHCMAMSWTQRLLWII